jgi:hypothetical protein
LGSYFLLNIVDPVTFIEESCRVLSEVMAAEIQVAARYLDLKLSVSDRESVYFRISAPVTSSPNPFYYHGYGLLNFPGRGCHDSHRLMRLWLGAIVIVA